MLRHRGPYLASAGILALGIGMSVAMFSFVDAVLIRPLPFPGQGSISVIWKSNPAAGSYVEELAYPELGDIQQAIPGFAYTAVMPTSLYGYGKVLQRGGAEPVQIESAPVSHDFFRVLGVSPVLGRNFAAADERVGAQPVAILSHAVWRDQFGSDRGVTGRLVRLNGQGYTVIGVMAPGVEFPRGAGLWVPLGVTPQVVERRGATFLQAIARAKPGQPDAVLGREVDALFQRLAKEHPEAYPPAQRAVVTPLVEYWTGRARVHLWIMLAASLLLLAAAIAGAGNLLLSRTLSRRAEIATRLALGATRGRILQQLAAEAAVVAGIALAAGLAIAQSAIRFLAAHAPADIPRLAETALNAYAFLFAAAMACAAAVACALAAGLSIARQPLEAGLREASVRTSLSRRGASTRSMFILAQAAVTVVLLALAALLALSYRAMVSGGTGFANRDALTMNLALRGPGLFSGHAISAAERRSFYARFLNRLRDSRGVTSAAAILVRPLEGAIGWERSYRFEFDTVAARERALPKANYEVITPSYFQTVGTPLLEGRDFTERDAEGSESVAIVSQPLAERIRAAGRAPVGHRMLLGGDSHWTTIVGVSAAARYRGLTQSGPDIFVPYLQAGPATNYLAVRGTQPAGELLDLARRTLKEMAPDQAISGAATIEALIDRDAAGHRFNMMLLLWFGVCSVILAGAGVFSVVAEAMAARRREMAIKTALGAGRFRLAREVVSGSLRFVLIGEAAGVCLTIFAGSWASGLLYQVSPRDPMILSCVAGFLFIVSALAGIWPAWSAAGRDPKAFLGSD